MTIAEEAAEKTGAVLTPPVWFGWSPPSHGTTGDRHNPT